ncbi:MAG: hypothetical protein MI867_20615 [Pseudomonadales bacterium]|nr:hypothetical protein [Pseudomonadales bacterium]
MNKNKLRLALVCLFVSVNVSADNIVDGESSVVNNRGNASGYEAFETNRYDAIRTQIKENRTANVETTLRTMIAANPQDYKALTLLAQLNVKNNNAKEAIAYYQDAFSFTPKVDTQDYLDRANQLMKLSPLPLSSIEVGLNQGIETLGYHEELMMLIVDANLLAKKQLRAHYWINSLSEDEQKKPSWLLKRAQIFEQQGDAKKAIALYRQVVTYINYQPVSSRRSPLLSQAREESYLAISRLAKN